MPGKVVKIPVALGDKVKKGDTLIIISAMKMESEYKVKKDRKIVEVCVSEGDNIDSNQALVIVE
jgi:biotin carboxyl carrier protein